MLWVARKLSGKLIKSCDGKNRERKDESQKYGGNGWKRDARAITDTHENTRRGCFIERSKIKEFAWNICYLRTKIQEVGNKRTRNAFHPTRVEEERYFVTAE
jgi:hypothetical protein